jgi:hypothetical protein
LKGTNPAHKRKQREGFFTREVRDRPNIMALRSAISFTTDPKT